MSDDKRLKKSHHKQAKFCFARPSYREARWERAVKVYTINQESRYLLVQGIPSVGVTKELIELFALYGPVDEYRILDEYPSEEFTDTYWIKFKKTQSARFAKKKLDMRSFFGGILHVSYAPEFESIIDTRAKLQERRKHISIKCKELHSKNKEESHGTTQNHPNNAKERIINAEETQTLPKHVPTNDALFAAQSFPHSSKDTGIPRIPPPPINLPFYLHPPPPPPPPDYPRIRTTHETLPTELQNISRLDMETKLAPDLADSNFNQFIASNRDVALVTSASSTTKHATSQIFADSSLSRLSGPSAGHSGCPSAGHSGCPSAGSNVQKPQREKRIVWATQPTVAAPSSSSCKAVPGAWDPFAESRKQSKSLTGDENLDKLAQRIREQVSKVFVESDPVAMAAATGPGNAGPSAAKKTRKRI